MTPAQREMQILRKYAAGGDLNTIAAETGSDISAVTAIASEVNFQRARAAELVRQHDAALTAHRAAGRLAAVPTQEAKQVTTTPETLEQLLDRAERTDKLRGKVSRARALLDELRRDLAAAELLVEAERQVERLRAELAAATTRVRTLTRGTAASIDALIEAPDPKTVRTWAARNGVACAAAGKVPRTVVEQYLVAKRAGQVAA